MYTADGSGVHRRQLLFRRAGHHDLLGRLCLGSGIKSIKNRGTNEDGKEEGDYVHSDTEKEGLPAANRVKSSSIHWILD
jgi:hypothetical protein